METVLLICTAYFVCRFVGAMARGEKKWPALTVIGWLLCAISAWLAAGGVGAYSPLWIALATGTCGWLISIVWDRWLIRTGSELVVIVLAGVLSVPALPASTIIYLCVLITCIGFGLDQLARKIAKALPLRLALVTVATVLVISAGLYLLRMAALRSTQQFGFHVRKFIPFVLNVGVTRNTIGKRIDLPNGGAAWLKMPAYQQKSPAAVLFHGADPKGSQQRAALVLRRALLESGFIVLSVDHPGFGKSALPADLFDETAWDPIPHEMAALAEMEKRVAADKIIVVGHSMGCVDALHICKVTPLLRGAILFGAGLTDLTDADRKHYWYGRFLRDRRVQQELPFELVETIRNNFYDRGQIAESLTPAHPPIWFVRFSSEHQDIVATRDLLFALIPGRKRALDLQLSNHYFTTCFIGGLLLGDTRSAHACARLFNAARREWYSTSGESEARRKVR